MEIALAGAGLGRDDLAVGDGENDAIDIGKLVTGRIDAIIIRVSFEYETVGGGLGLQDPRFERRKIGIIVAVHAVHTGVQCRPVAKFRLFNEGSELGLIGIFLVKLLKIMGRAIDEQRVGSGEIGQKQRVGPRPAIADRGIVQDFEARRLALRQHRHRQAGGRQLRILGDILKPITKILGGERLPVRPLHALAQMKREDASVFDIDRFEDVGLEFERRRVADQPRIAVDHHHAGVLGAGHQHPQLAARPADSGDLRYRRVARHPIVDLGQLAAGDLRLEIRRLLQCRTRRAGQGQQQRKCQDGPPPAIPPRPIFLVSRHLPIFRQARARPPTPPEHAAGTGGGARASTAWPGAISISRSESAGPRQNGSGHAAGSDARSSSKR